MGALWGVLLFGEIRGMRNFIILGSAVGLNIVAVTLITLSKMDL